MKRPVPAPDGLYRGIAYGMLATAMLTVLVIVLWEFIAWLSIVLASTSK